jgi:class 3 adenylate cyclase/CHASE2 domain-containing sensor protein
MKGKTKNRAPFRIAAAALLFSVTLHIISRTLAERPANDSRTAKTGLTEQLEVLTYDARAKLGASLNDLSRLGKNMAILFFDGVTADQVNDGTLAPYYAPAVDLQTLTNLYPRVWPWPRFIHGQIVRELAAEGATAVGFDIMFAELAQTRDEESVHISGTETLTSDQFFALQLKRAHNAYLAVERDTVPHPLFLTNTAGLGAITAQSDFSVLRRIKPYETVRVWHPLLRSKVRILSVDLSKGRVMAGKIIIPPLVDTESKPAEVPLNPNGTMKLTADGDIDFADDPNEKGPQTEFAFVNQRVWNLGITLGAKALGLDLEHPEIQSRRIILHGTNGIVRTIPLDSAGYLNIDWSIRVADVQRDQTPVYFGRLQRILLQDKFRAQGDTNDLKALFKNKIVLIASMTSGNNMSDFGATPLDSHTPLATAHLNIANSLLTGRFVERTSLPIEVLLIVVLGCISAILTWRTRMVIASMAICGLSTAYILFTVWMYLDHRYWIPIVMPVGGGFILPYFSLVSYKAIFEQREQRRIRGIFSKMVSPEIVHEVLSVETLAALSGARRAVTVFFADVRGFTEFTDSTQQAAEEFAKKNNLSTEQTRAYYDKVAAEQIETVNVYLATIADIIKQHRGTLDKYMGDCVMAFWGAPVTNDRHAIDCVCAAIEAQRRMHTLNQQREKENERRQQENADRQPRGEPPLPPLPTLSLGTGINTGSATVGLMGSNEHIMNYTVFGREVNLASRLEGASGRGRILISEATHRELKRLDPELASTCIPHPPITPKGFRQPIPIYEVPWKIAAPAEANKISPAPVAA